MSERIGLIAGNGQFPILFAKGASSQGREVIAIAVREETDAQIENYAHRTHWIGVGQLREFFEILKNEKLKRVVMAGQIRPAHIFDKAVSKDEALTSFLKRVKDKRADSLLGGIARLLKAMGIKLLDSSMFLKDHLVARGVLTNIAPSDIQWQDIKFGRKIAKRIAGLDIGQTVVVKDKAILAIEAIEGTDEAIRRGGKLGREAGVVVKVSKPHQDMRFDIPLIGPRTLDSLISASCAVLAMEAGKTLFLEKEECLKIAEENKISLVGI
ncbi:MAG: UDP-2,3-diacylglucosamine diphosphatase LpxI [Candidatus Omnitrophota bacterium]|nr:MAG: UDP-2,3-diacylglucosamine diphosphatase LpxI [Candidatus Omnitrophota bacterium]